MRKILMVLLVAVIATSLTIPAFAEIEELASPDSYWDRFRGQNVSINVYNWGEYLSDGTDDTMNVNQEFEKLTGIKVYYTTFATNEELYSKLRGGASNYDVVIPSDYMIGRMISEDMLEPINHANVPNLSQIEERFLDPSYDPGCSYSVPYTWGVTGIIYNTTMVDDEVTSWDILWDAKYIGEILMFSNPRDAFGVAQRKLGYSMNATDPDELADCLEALKEQKLLVQAYVMDEIFDKMLGSEAALAPYYAGDAVTMIDQNPDLDFAVPEEGTNIFVDAACIPKGSSQKEAAEMYINFLCEPEVAMANAEYIGYATPNAGALELLDEEITGNPIAYPPQELIDNAEYFNELPRETSLLMDQLWTELLSSDENYSRMLMPVLLFVGVAVAVGINVIRVVGKKKKQKFYF